MRHGVLEKLVECVDPLALQRVDELRFQDRVIRPSSHLRKQRRHY